MVAVYEVQVFSGVWLVRAWWWDCVGVCVTFVSCWFYRVINIKTNTCTPYPAVIEQVGMRCGTREGGREIT